MRNESRNSHQRCSIKKAVLKIFLIFTGKQLCSFNKVPGLQVIEKKLQHWCFPLHVRKFLRTLILKKISERLLLWVFFSIVSKVSLYGLWLSFTFSFYPFQPCPWQTGQGSTQFKTWLKSCKNNFQVVEVSETVLHKFYVK